MALKHWFSVKEKGKQETFHGIPCEPGEEQLGSDGIQALTQREQKQFPLATLEYRALSDDTPTVHPAKPHP
jgi:hypothetical protein